jgi:hypothetical protein
MAISTASSVVARFITQLLSAQKGRILLRMILAKGPVGRNGAKRVRITI